MVFFFVSRLICLIVLFLMDSFYNCLPQSFDRLLWIESSFFYFDASLITVENNRIGNSASLLAIAWKTNFERCDFDFFFYFKFYTSVVTCFTKRRHFLLSISCKSLDLQEKLVTENTQWYHLSFCKDFKITSDSTFHLPVSLHSDIENIKQYFK